MVHIRLDEKQIERVKNYAKEIADEISLMIASYSTVSVERAVLRLYGVDGVDKDNTPLPNRLVDMLQQKKLLESGASYHFTAAMLESGRSAQLTAELLEQGHIEFSAGYTHSKAAITKREEEMAGDAIKQLDSSRQRKREKQQITPVTRTALEVYDRCHR